MRIKQFRLPILILTILILAWYVTRKPKGDRVNLPINTSFCENIHRNDSFSLSQQLAPLQAKMDSQTGVFVLENGDGSMVTRAWLTEYAEKTIDIQYFIFSTDNVGLIACDYLVRAADRGVKVRIIIDDIMVHADVNDLLIFSSHPNIELKIYNPGVNLNKSIAQKIGAFASDFRGANQRMHNKTFTVDNQVVITGGRNIADEYFDYDHEYNFRDRDVLFLGKEVPKVTTSFNQFWNDNLSVLLEDLVDEQPESINHPKRFDLLHEYACNPENFWPQIRTRIENLPQTFSAIQKENRLVWLDSVSFISDLPGKNDGTHGLEGGGITSRQLVELVQNAKSSIDIQSPYLITTAETQQLFKSAVERGVKIRILTNSLASTDNVEAFSSYQSSRKELLATGVEVYEFKPDAEERHKMMTSDLHQQPSHQPIFGLHAKSMVIDGHITVIGTFNLDPRSTHLNTECLFIVDSEQITHEVARGMEVEFGPQNSWHITSGFNPDDQVSKGKRIKTWTRKILPKSIL